jgi:hypothetical protein
MLETLGAKPRGIPSPPQTEASRRRFFPGHPAGPSFDRTRISEQQPKSSEYNNDDSG